MWKALKEREAPSLFLLRGRTYYPDREVLITDPACMSIQQASSNEIFNEYRGNPKNEPGYLAISDVSLGYRDDGTNVPVFNRLRKNLAAWEASKK